MTRSIIHVDGRVEKFLANPDARSVQLTLSRYPDSVVLHNGERFESIPYVPLSIAQEMLQALRGAYRILARELCPFGVAYVKTGCECNYHADAELIMAAILKAEETS